MTISEDIKILKDVIHDRDSLSERDFKAIENVLNRLAELEKENKRKAQRLDRQFKLLIKKDRLIKNSIPKSVIREKIDKLEREFHFFAGREHTEWQDGEFDGDVCDDLALQIGTLKELLGEEI